MAASTLDLAAFTARLRAFLVDADSAAYSDDAAKEAFRQSTADLGRAYGVFVTIEDLDSALATNVDKLDEDLVVRGAAGYAARMRAVDRADSANLGQSMPANLLDWSKNTLYWFDDKLKAVRLRVLQQSTANKPAALTWDESDKNW